MPGWRKGIANLPTGLWLQTSDLHAIDGASRPGDIAIRGPGKVILAAWTTGKLNCEAFTFELGPIYSSVRAATGGGGGTEVVRKAR